MNVCVLCERGELPSVQSCLTLSEPVTWNQWASERREQKGGHWDETETARKSLKKKEKDGVSHSTE